VAPGSLSHRHRRSGFLVPQKVESDDGSEESKVNRIVTLTLGLGTYHISVVPDLPLS
jgi:hypothetical protein